MFEVPLIANGSPECHGDRDVSWEISRVYKWINGQLEYLDSKAKCI